METQLNDVVLKVDESEVSLIDVIKSNVIDEQQVTVEELISILTMKVGDVVCIGMVDVERIK